MQNRLNDCHSLLSGRVKEWVIKQKMSVFFNSRVTNVLLHSLGNWVLIDHVLVAKVGILSLFDVKKDIFVDWEKILLFLDHL